MKIERTRPTGTPTRVGATRADAGASEPAAAANVRQIEDTTAIMGVPEAELTPKVRHALMQLFEEVAKLREELERSKTRLADPERLADEDSLVPISNRRAFVRELSRIIAYAQRYQMQSSVAYFDFNDMKATNDKFGHLAGDAALKHVASALVENIREPDVVRRLGGDEFGVIPSPGRRPEGGRQGERSGSGDKRDTACVGGAADRHQCFVRGSHLHRRRRRRRRIAGRG
jgi:GGDEF domain-containing protein